MYNLWLQQDHVLRAATSAWKPYYKISYNCWFNETVWNVIMVLILYLSICLCGKLINLLQCALCWYSVLLSLGAVEGSLYRKLAVCVRVFNLLNVSEYLIQKTAAARNEVSYFLICCNCTYKYCVLDKIP